MDAIRGQEAVSDALRQAVFIKRIAEIVVGVDVILSPRRRCHPDLGRRLEPLEDLPPIAVVPGAAPMAFVDDDEIEEIPRILSVEAGAVLVTRDGLVDREVHVATFDRDAASYLVTSVAKRAEILCHRIVDEDVAIGENRIFGFRLTFEFQRVTSFQQIWKATAVLPAPVHSVRRARFLP